MTEIPSGLAEAREQFLAIVATIRPELHRYCARLTGSVIDGEDIVQETLAKAFYALSQSADVPPLRPWLFRIAHNAAVDFLKSHGRTKIDPDVELDDIVAFDEAPDPLALKAALRAFLALPVRQRSAVILKDVLGHSLDETAETMSTTVMAVKAALVRGRETLRKYERGRAETVESTRADLEKYARLFNARDWDGLRALVSEECRLDLISKSQRRGKEVGAYFGNYQKQNVTVRVARLEDQLALGVYVAGAHVPASYGFLGRRAKQSDAVKAG